MSLPYDRNALGGRVAVVAGATRGAGRGIAAALGEAGATVICTGRTSSQRAIKSDYDRSETIEETAAIVSSLGGKGIAIPVDHLVADEVEALAERLHKELGKIDMRAPLYSSPVVAEGVLYVVTPTHLYSIQDPSRL